MEITKIEEAVAVLKKHRYGQSDNWRIADDCVLGGPNLEHDMWHRDVIAVSNYLLMRERLGELEQENAGLERRLGVARDALTLAKQYGNFDPLSDQTIIRAIDTALAQLNAVADKGETADAVQGQSGGGNE